MGFELETGDLKLGYNTYVLIKQQYLWLYIDMSMYVWYKRYSILNNYIIVEYINDCMII